MPVTKWKADKQEIQRIIAKTLDSGEQNWTELWNSVKETIGSKTTLSLYLDAMIQTGDVVRREKRGSRKERTHYSLIRTPRVLRLLGQPEGETIVHAVIEYNRLNEQEFLDLVCSSITSDVLNMLQYLVSTVHKDEQEIEGSEQFRQLLQGFLSNLLDKLRIHGEYLAERIENGSFDSAHLSSAMSSILNELRNQQILLEKKTSSRPYLAEQVTPLKMSIGVLKYDARRMITPEDIGLQKIYHLNVTKLQK